MKNMISFIVRLALGAVLSILPSLPAQATPQWATLTISVTNSGNPTYGDGLYIYIGMLQDRGYYAHSPYLIQWRDATEGWTLNNGVGGLQSLGFDELPKSVDNITVSVSSQANNVSGNPSGDDAATTEPVNVINGGMFFDETDLRLVGSGFGLHWTRTYNSALTVTNGLGFRWSHNYDWNLTATTNTYINGSFTNSVPALYLAMGGGAARMLLKNGTNSWSSTYAPPMTVTLTTNNEYFLPLPSGYSCLFGTNGLIKAMSNAWANTLVFSYTNVAGNVALEKVTHSDGRALQFSYSSNRLVRVDTPSTNLCYLYSYNQLGELTNAVTRLSSGDFSSFYTYDTNGVHAMTRHANPLGEVATYAYMTNAQGQLTTKCAKVDVATNYYEHTLSYSGAVSTVAYTRGNTNSVYRYSFDPVSKLISRIDLPGDTNEVKLMSYDSLTLAKTGEQQGTPTYVARGDKCLVDSSGRLLTYFPAYTSTSSPSWAFGWNTNWDSLASVTDPEGHTIQWDYTNGTVSVERHYPATNQSVETRYTYISNGLLASVTNANGHWTDYRYNGYGYPTQTVAQSGFTNWMTWNVLGHLTELRLPSTVHTTNEPPVMIPRIITFDPDELGRVRTITYPDNSQDTFVFDRAGNVTNHVDPAGRTTRYAWLPTRKLASTSRTLTGTSNVEAKIEFAYDQQFNALNIKDELGRPVESYQLDLQDRPIKITNVDSQQMTIAWGLGNMVKSVVRFDGSTNGLAYDEGYRVNQATYPGITNTFRYFKNSLMMVASNRYGVVSNSYDGANRLILTQVSGLPTQAVTVAYQLDAVGNPTNTQASSLGYSVSRTFDAGERLSSLSVSPSSLPVFQFAYSIFDGLLSTSSLPNGVSVKYERDSLDRTTSIVWRNASNQVLRSRAYDYSAAGMITNAVYESGERVTYNYDSLDRLTGEKHADGYGQVLSEDRYEYDLTGNRTKKTVLDSDTNALITVNYALSTGNRLASWSVAETNLLGRVDMAGFASELVGTNDRFGYLWVSNAVSGAVKPQVAGTNFWAYDLTVGLGTQKLVAAIRDMAGNMGYATNTILLTVVTNGTYQHNAAGCVTNIAYRGKDYSQTLGLTWDGQYQLTAAATNGVVVERYGHDAFGRRVWTWDAANGTNWHVYDGSHVIADLNATGRVVRTYVWGPGIDNLLAMTTYGGTTNTYFPLKDHLNSVLALTDSAGQIAEQYRYDAWGRTTVFGATGNPLSASALGNRYCWQGREYSFKTGLYCFRARWYDPITGRWLSNDPIGISGGLNQYVFCNNNPVNFRDPFGLCGTTPNWPGNGGANTVSGATGQVPYNQPFVPTAFYTTPSGNVPPVSNPVNNGLQNTAANLIAALGGNTTYGFPGNVGLAEGTFLPAIAGGIPVGLATPPVVAFSYTTAGQAIISAGSGVVSQNTPGPSILGNLWEVAGYGASAVWQWLSQ